MLGTRTLFQYRELKSSFRVHYKIKYFGKFDLSLLLARHY